VSWALRASPNSLTISAARSSAGAPRATTRETSRSNLWAVIRPESPDLSSFNPAHVPFRRVNNPTLGEFCFAMIGRADIEGSKSDVAKNAWPPQASYPFGNFSDTSGFRSRTTKGSLGHSFEVRIITGDRNQGSFYPFVRHEISLLVELPFGHPCCLLTDVPPQPNSPPNDVFGLGVAGRGPPGLPSGIPSGACVATLARKEGLRPIPTPPNEKNNDGDGGISGSTGVSHLCYVRPCCFSTSD
jgi:hypothetical protein